MPTGNLDMEKVVFGVFVIKMAPNPHAGLPLDTDPADLSWNQRLRHARYFRLVVKKSFGDTMNNMQIVQLRDGGGPVLFGVGGSEPQTVISAQVPDALHSRAEAGMETDNSLDEPTVVPEVGLKPLFSMNQQADDMHAAAPSAEVQLFYERMRCHVVSGITGFSWHCDTGSLLLSSFNRVEILRNGEILPVAEWFSGAILNATLCPSDPDFTAFCSAGQLYVDCKNSQFYSTRSIANHTHGVASFVAQEELERFEGFWWNPRCSEILYEEVDESPVAQLSFDIPGRSCTEPMRYPLTGSSNPISRLRLITLDKKSANVTEKALPAGLKELFPWYEYLSRAGWVDADYCYVVILNRRQTRQALVLINKKAFGDADASPETIRREYVFVVYQEMNDAWINFQVSNLLYFLPHVGPELRFLYGSEKNGLCHLYLRTCRLTALGQSDSDTSGVQEAAVTSGNWAVIKEAPLAIDKGRSHVYFLANFHSPIVTSLCVASYHLASGTKSLTPSDLCYRQERGQFNLNINPEVGFVAWVSSAERMPECRFYRLIQTGASSLPQSVYLCRLKVQPSIMPSPGTTKDILEETEYLKSPLTDLFTVQFIEYTSDESLQTHHAAIFLPKDPPRTATGLYPVVHHVYAGPCVQLVKNSWTTAAQFLKYVSLGYAVVVIDGRGSANRGIAFEAPLKNNLGTVEVRDQMDGLMECLTREPLLDRNRIVVTGWSYGGYMSLQLLCNYPHVYRAACAGGAVSDWHLYDTCYTERYMDLPKDNPVGYKASNISKLAHKFPNEEGRLLIVHGLIDENVHFHHTEQLINALIAAGKPFEQLIFPSERHGIRQGTAVEYFHASMLSFFARALK
uniref:Dipeptidyl-peptidase IV n=1 Tax=Panagrellus redivivus TaxID=6233 RepID=A0A7E4V2X7_PANRE